MVLTMGVKMEKLFWNTTFSVGIEKLDSQHKYLFAIINKFTEKPATSYKAEQISEILKEMAEYAREHFTAEENLMQEYGYPELEQHKWQHKYFIDTTAELLTNFMHGSETTSEEISDFLTLWLTKHILKVDMKYRDFFKTKLHTNAH
jgi:hemerythrin